MDPRIIPALIPLIISCGCIGETPIDTNLTISEDVIDLCRVKGEIVCYGDCVDGFGSECYFDSTLYSRDELETGIYFPRETEDACFAIHSSSVCGECHNTFKLRETGELAEVSCEEFFQTIENRNNSCNGCVNVIQSGCC